MSGSRFVFTATAIAITLAVHVFYYAWLTRRARRFRDARARRRLVLFLAGMIVVPLVARVFLFFGANDRLSWIEGAGILWVLALIAATPVILVIEIVRRMRDRSSPPVDRDRRDALTSLAGNAFVGATLVPYGWGMIRTRFDVELTEISIKIPRLARVLDGFTIVQVSDVHVGPYVGESELRRAEDLVRGARPDLLAMTGDLVHLRESYLPLACGWLARLRDVSRFGLVGILGNHEYYVGKSAVMRAYRDAGLDLLVNEVRRIAKDDGGGFSLAGVDDFYAANSGRGAGPRLDLVCPALFPDRARILLCHQPQLHAQAAAWDLDLQLSGHTHGGQIAPLGSLAVRALYGHYAGYTKVGGCHLYVNRGLGTSGPPSRVAVRPEITKIVLVSS